MPNYQCLVTSYQYHVLYWWIAPEMDRLCVSKYFSGQRSLPRCLWILSSTVYHSSSCASVPTLQEGPWGSAEGRGTLFYMMQEEWKPLGKAARCLPRVPNFPWALYPRGNDRSTHHTTCFLNKYFCLRNVLGRESSAPYCWSKTSPQETLVLSMLSKWSCGHPVSTFFF